MTNEEVLNFIAKERMINSQYGAVEDDKVYEKVMELLEKQIPKKPIDAYKTCDTGEITYWVCPNCNYEHEVHWGGCDTDYCYNCGQAIDWELEELG